MPLGYRENIHWIKIAACCISKGFEEPFNLSTEFCLIFTCQSKVHSFEQFFTGSHPTIICSKLTTETLEQGVKYVQS